MYQSDLAYRQASLEGATHIGVLTLVYDALAADLRQAGQAQQDRSIQGRCDASNHALLLLGHLEAWAAGLDDLALVKGLEEFYGLLRARIVGLQGNGTQEDFRTLSNLVLEVRSTWQEKSQRASQTSASSTAQLAPLAGLDEHRQSRPMWLA